jgi:membrane protease YdiL (CAAX protease family)
LIEWIIALGVGLAVSMAIYFIAFSIMVILTKRKKAETKLVFDSPWMSNAIVGPIVLVLSTLVIFLASNGNLSLWGFQWPTHENMIVLSLIGLFVALIVVLVSERFSPTPENMNPPRNLRGRILFFIMIVLLASAAEEILFRGFLQGILDHTLLLSIDLGWFSITGGALVSGILFSLVHIAPAKQMKASIPVMITSAFILGFVAGIFVTYSGSLVMPILLHLEFNLIGFIVGLRSN